MKKIIITITILILSTVTPAKANFQCGLKPFTPMGCFEAEAICTCSNYNQCQWQWIGCK
jgi:hypothetical protein